MRSMNEINYTVNVNVCHSIEKKQNIDGAFLFTSVAFIFVYKTTLVYKQFVVYNRF